MVKIIKPGDLGRAEKRKRFACPECGCVWEASRHEYVIESDYRNGLMYASACPTCKKVCYAEEGT